MSLLIKVMSKLFNTPDGNSGGTNPDLSPNDVLKMFDTDEDSGDTDDVLDLDDTSKKGKTSAEKSSKSSVDSESRETSGDSEDSEGGEGSEDGDEGKESDDLDDLEDDLADDEVDADKEEFELIAPARKREILAKYPKLFKDFPYLEVAYYRDRQYSEVFPSVGEAREAKEGLAVLSQFDNDLKTGNIETILSAALQSDKNSFYTIVDNLLPALANLDEKAYHHVIGNVSKKIISAMVADSDQPGMEVLKQAALIVNQYIYGTNEYKPPTNLATKPEGNPEADKLATEKRQFLQERFTEARTDVATKIDNAIRATLDQNIDRNGQMTDYVKKTAMRDAQEKLEDILRKDTRFRSLMGKLWQKAQMSNFNEESRKSIRSAYLGRAKALLPGILSQVRRDALKGMSKKVKSDDESDEVITRQTSRKGPIAPGGSTTSVNRGNNGSDSRSKDKIPDGMSIRDWLLKD